MLRHHRNHQPAALPPKALERALSNAIHDHSTRQPYFNAFKSARNQLAAAKSEMVRLAEAIRQADGDAGDPLHVFDAEHRNRARARANHFAQERDTVYRRMAGLQSGEALARMNVENTFPGFMRSHAAVKAALASNPNAASGVDAEIARLLTQLLNPVSAPVTISPQENLVCESDICVRFHNGTMFRASAGEWIRAASLGEHLHPLRVHTAKDRVLC